MRQIIIDTNGLLAITEFKIDVFSELETWCDFNYKIYVVEGTIDELRKIAEKQRERFSRAAKIALKILKMRTIPTLPNLGGRTVDDDLVEYSEQGYLVLTQDLGLKRRLHKPYLTIRQKKRIIEVK